MLKPGERIATDLSEIAALQEDITAKAEAARTYWSMGYPINVIDERLGLGFGKIQGGDTGYVPLTVIPATGTSGAVPEKAVKTIKTIVTRKAASVPEYGSPRHKALLRKAILRWTPYSRRMQEKLRADFEKQRKAVRKALAVKQGDRPHVPTDAEQFFDSEEWITYFALAYEQFYSDAARASAQGVLADLGMDIPITLTDPTVQDAIRNMRMKFAEDINGETLRMLEDTLRELMVEADQGGWSIWQIQEELGKRTDGVFGLRQEQWQLERIARTEMHKASSLGSLEGAKQSGIKLQKAWIAAFRNTRDSHIAAHARYRNNPIPINELFEVGACRTDAPGHSGCPEEDIQCQCDLFYIPVDTGGLPPEVDVTYEYE